MHVLAYVYNWDRNSLWDIPLNERRRWVERVIRQKEEEAEALENSK